MKKIIILVMLAMICFLFFASSAMAASTDTFTITVVCRYYSINLKAIGGADYTTWDAGTLDAGNSATMDSTQGVWASVVAVGTYQLKGQALDAGGWQCAASADTSKYVLETTPAATKAVPDMTGAIKLSESGNYALILSNVVEDTTKVLYFRITAPTDTGDGDTHTITVTIQVSKST